MSKVEGNTYKLQLCEQKKFAQRERERERRRQNDLRFSNRITGFYTGNDNLENIKH